MLKNPNRYSTLILQKGHQGCEIFYQIFPFSRHFAVQCKSFFFPLFFPTISLLSFQVVLSLKHLFYIFRKFFSKFYPVLSQKCPYAEKVAWLSTRRNFGTESSDKIIRKSLQKVLCCALTFPGVQLIFEVSELCFVKDPPIQ